MRRPTGSLKSLAVFQLLSSVGLHFKPLAPVKGLSKPLWKGIPGRPSQGSVPEPWKRQRVQAQRLPELLSPSDLTSCQPVLLLSISSPVFSTTCSWPPRVWASAVLSKSEGFSPEPVPYFAGPREKWKGRQRFSFKTYWAFKDDDSSAFHRARDPSKLGDTEQIHKGWPCVFFHVSLSPSSRSAFLVFLFQFLAYFLCSTHIASVDIHSLAYIFGSIPPPTTNPFLNHKLRSNLSHHWMHSV